MSEMERWQSDKRWQSRKKTTFSKYEKVVVCRWKMSIRQHNNREGLFKHVYLHQHSALSLRARATSCCTLLPQKHRRVTHPSLHPVLTKHSVTVSKTSLSTFASPCMKKREMSVYQCELSNTPAELQITAEALWKQIEFYGYIQYIKGLYRWYSITNMRHLFLSLSKV